MTLNELINELSFISRRMSTGDVPLLINSQPLNITEVRIDPSAVDLHVKIDTNAERSMYNANANCGAIVGCAGNASCGAISDCTCCRAKADSSLDA